MFPPSSVKINLVELQRPLSPHEISNSPEEQHDRQSQISFEKVLGGSELGCERRSNGDEELGGERNVDQEETEIGTVDTANGLEGDIVNGTTSVSPSCAEADMRL